MASMIKKGFKYLMDPHYRFAVNVVMGKYDNMSDEEFIKLKWKDFYSRGGIPTVLDLDNPQTLCEKLQWLKLFYRKPELTMMVDKYQAKEYVRGIVGDEHIIPTIGVWDNVDDIEFDELPDRFVLKNTHDSGGLVICKDKNTFDVASAKKFFKKYLHRNYYKQSREWPYKNVKPRIIAEPFIEGLGNIDSVEYKATCMNGRVAFVTICTGIAHDDFDKRWNDHFDPDFNKLDWYVNYKPAHKTPNKPKQWEELIKFYEKLCGNLPYVRVDSYIINGKIIFGEFTFFTWAGFMNFEPKEWDLKLGQMLELPKENMLD